MPIARKAKPSSRKNPKTSARTSASRKKAIRRKPEEPQEFPISHSVLRQIYDSMIECRLWAKSKGFVPCVSEATAVPAALAVKATDIFAAPADGKTLYPITHSETTVVAYDPASLWEALPQLRRKHRHGIALAVTTESAFDADASKALLFEALENLWPIVFIVLSDRPFHPSAHVIEIDVDGHDAVAVFRVVSEAIRRARNGRGPAVIHAQGATTPLSANSQDNPLARFQAYLNAKGLSTEDIHVLHQD